VKVNDTFIDGWVYWRMFMKHSAMHS